MVDKICIVCGELKKHYAKGMCRGCYHREYGRERYHNDPEYREKQLEYRRERWRERYHNDPEYREKMLEYGRERYHNDPEYREKQLEYGRERWRERYKNPEYREKKLEYGRRWRAVRLERTKFLLENPEELEKLRKKIMEEEENEY